MARVPARMRACGEKRGQPCVGVLSAKYTDTRSTLDCHDRACQTKNPPQECRWAHGLSSPSLDVSSTPILERKTVSLFPPLAAVPPCNIRQLKNLSTSLPSMTCIHPPLHTC